MMAHIEKLICRFLTSPLYAGAAFIMIGVFSLGFALTSQYGFGLAPCDLCIYQRWPYGIVIALGIFAMLLGRTAPKKSALIIALSGAVFMAGMVIAIYHTGVEQKWWDGLKSCTTPDFSDPNLTTEELEQLILAAPVVSCGDIPWSLFGLSMAAYNAILSFFYMVYGFIAAVFITRKANGL